MTDDKKKFQAEWDKLLTPPTKPKATAPVGVLSEPEMADVLRQAGWPESEVPYMAKMGTKESSGVAGASRIRRAGEGQNLPEASYGIWQINTLAHPQYDKNRLISDPVYNAKAALEIFKKQGYDAWFNSRRKLAAEGIVPGKAPALQSLNVEDLFPNADGFKTAPAPAVDAKSLFPNADGFSTAPSPTNPTGAYTPIDPTASAIPQTPTDVGIPEYTAPAKTDVAPVTSRPNPRPVLQRSADRAVAPVQERPTGAVASEPMVGEEFELAPLDAQVQEPIKAQNSKDVSDRTVLGVVDVDPSMSPEDKIRYAGSAALAKYGVTPAQVDEWVTKSGDKAFQGDPTSGKITITANMLAQIKGADEAKFLVEGRQRELQKGYEEIPPEELVTLEIADQIAASTNLSGTPFDWDELPLLGTAGDLQNTAAGLLGSGGRVWRGLAGLYRAADELNKNPFGDGTNRFINPQEVKAYRGDDVYKYMTSIADEAESSGQQLAQFGGTRAEIFQMVGGLPGDLSRIMLMSHTPGGIISGMSADMAAQAAGRGEEATQVAKEGMKGALLGSIARFATPIGQGIAQNTGSRVAGGVGALAFTGAATYPTSRAFGADVKTALKETLYNTIFAMADAAPVLAGRRIRVKDTEGTEVAVEVKPDGTVEEVQIPAGEKADVEVLDTKAAKGVEAYREQEFKVKDLVQAERKRPLADLAAEAEFTVGDDGTSLGANLAGISALNELFYKNQRSVTDPSAQGFSGAALSGDLYFDAFIRYANKELDEATRAGDGGQMVTYSNLIAKLEQAKKQTGGRAALYVDLPDMPEFSQGTRSEEFTHLANNDAGIQTVARDIVDNVPSMQDLLEGLDSAYDKRDLPYRVDEAIAKSMRTNASVHLGIEPRKIHNAQRELFRYLEGLEGFDEKAFAESLEGVSRFGGLFSRYAKLRERQQLARESGPAIERRGEEAASPLVRDLQEAQGARPGDSPADDGSDPGRQLQRGDIQEGVRAEDEIAPDDFVAPREQIGDTVNVWQVRSVEGDVAHVYDTFTGDYATIPLKDLKVFQKAEPGKPPSWMVDPNETPVHDEVDLFQGGETPDLGRLTEGVDYLTGKPKEVAAVEPVKTNLTEERRSYLTSILEGKDPEIVTQKVGNQEVKFLKNNKAKIMLQPDDVPFVEQAMAGRGMDPQMARLFHGSRHRFLPEIKVRNKETGEEKFIAGEKPVDFPQGTRLSRRGDNLIVRREGKTDFEKARTDADTNGLDFGQMLDNIQKYTDRPSRELIPADTYLPPVPDGWELVEKFPLGRIRDDKINTGEGAQYMGYGHYAAEKGGVASTYRKAGTSRSPEQTYMFQGQEYQYRSLNSRGPGSLDKADIEADAIMGTFVSMENNQVDAQSAIDIQLDYIADDLTRYARLTKENPGDLHYKFQAQYLTAMQKAYRSLDPADFDIHVEEPHPGYLYRLKSNVPDDHMLRLDEQLKRQPERVQDVVESYQRENFGDERPDADGVTGKQFYNILEQQLSRYPGSKKPDAEASAYLQELGLKGMKFLDQDSRNVLPGLTYKGIPLSIHNFTFRHKYNALIKVQDEVLAGKSFEDAIQQVRQNIGDQKGGSWREGERMLSFLETLDPKDLRLREDNRTYNHIFFSGDDVEVTRIQFAKAFKDNRIFDEKTQKEVVQYASEEFPQLFSLLRRPSSGKPLAVNPNAAAAERMQAARGMDEPGRMADVVNKLVQLYQSFKRQFKEIDPNESVEMARAGDSFRLMSSLNNWAKVQATNDVSRITEGLTREQYDVFENVLVLRDKQQAMEKGMKPGHGYADLADVEASLKVYESAATADPAIAKALAERENLRHQTVKGLVDIGMLGEEALDNTRYFHRQVPQQAESNLFLSLGSRDLRVRKKGFEKKRTGEGDDYNTNYVEAEVEWLSQAHAQIRKNELLHEIERAVNIADDLKLEAKILGQDWHGLVPQTHRIWQPKEGSYFYNAMTVPDQLLDMVVMKSGVLPSTPIADLREALVRGQRRPEWVLPKGVAKLMDDFSTRIEELPHANLYSNAQASWKQWMLINPKNYLSYNLRNFISDLDAAMAYPGVIKELPQAIKDVYGYSRSKNHSAAAEIEQAIKDGVMDSGQTFAEIPDIGKLGVFKMFSDTDPNLLSRGMTKVWDVMKGTTNARENWIRLAAYRHLKKKIDAGETIYGASTQGQVEALTPGRQAAKVARELVGDYGGISEAGRAIRKHAIPFYSWLEINAPRYVRMIKNMPAESAGGSRLLGVGVGKVVFGGAKLSAKLTAITLAINAWNHLMFPDLEDDLKKTDIGKRPHLIVGRNPDGSARVFQADTALRDAMDWFDLGDAVSDVYQLQTGQATAADKLAEAVKAPVNRVVQGLGPFKTGFELVTGRSTFPSIFEKGTGFGLQTRPIRDRAEHLAQAFAVKGIYQKVTGRATPPSSGPIGQVSDWFLTMRVDPKESIYWHMKSKVQEYKKKIGKASPGSDPTEKSNTLFYYKQALRWNDPIAAERFLDQYMNEFGGTKKGLKASLKKSHPLGSMAKKDWDDFTQTLSPEEKEMLDIAIQYFEGEIKK